MGTAFTKVYDAFTAKVLDDEWYNWDEEDVKKDMFELLQGAIVSFKFPRNTLEFDYDEEDNPISFKNDLNLQEIQIIATYMKIEWINRQVLTWQTLKPLYAEKDFSQANLIDKYVKLLDEERTHVKFLESYYYRSIDYSPYPFSKMAGNG